VLKVLKVTRGIWERPVPLVPPDPRELRVFRVNLGRQAPRVRRVPRALLVLRVPKVRQEP
jgi:hypothetical protein